MNELNKKLAEWAGFKFFPPIESGAIDVIDPNGSLYLSPSKIAMPDFTTSLDACFKWLVPKLDYPVLLSSHIGTDKVIRYSCLIEVCDVPHPWEYGVSLIETPALALCKAIEKLIDDSIKQ